MADKIKQFAKEIKEENKDYLADDDYVIKLCDMLIEAVESLEMIALDEGDLEDVGELQLIDIIKSDTTTARESLSRLAGRLK